jgi:EAL domain-containing protein (putative c-di-GMP-specific phosphodiesterase class I)
MTFQPILDTASGVVVGVEALARFYDESSDPSHWFAEAHGVGLGIELELLAVSKALACLPQLPDAWCLTVNIGPETIVSRGFADILADVDARRVVMELTEHRRVADYLGLMKTLQQLRATGARLAIDDTGTGFSSLSHILKLAPDFIHLDRDLVAGIDVDPVRRVLAASLVSFASGTGAAIIAEGVESQDEIETLERLGVHLSQGFYHGQPACIERLFGSLVVEQQRHSAAALHAGTEAEDSPSRQGDTRRPEN